MGTGKNKMEATEAAELRRRAEELLSGKTAEAPPRTEAELQRLIHELQVYRIELEMQNEELHAARKAESMALEKFTELYDFAPVGYCTLDREGIILGVNLSGASLLGMERSLLIGRRLGHFIPQEESKTFAEFIARVFTGGAKEACDAKILKGEKSPLFVRIEAVAAASGEECRVAMLDITERKEAEEAQKQAKEAAEAATRTKSQFLANMSHELRTPMTGVLGMLDLALLGNLEGEEREFIEIAQTSARSLVRILNDILDLSKIEAGKFSIEGKPFSIRRCLENMSNLLAPVAKCKGIDFIFMVADDVPKTLVGDQNRLNQVLTNLTGNALKFTDKGKVEIRVAAGGSAPDGRRAVTFTFTDTGIGIPAGKRELIFQSFSQVDESHNRSYGGAGLGLAISREIVERMGGAIGFTSEEGKGSVFSCTIPFGEVEAEHDEGFAAEVTATTGDAPCAEMITKPRLLVAEDDPINMKVLGTMLQMAKYETDFAENGRKAVEMWESGKYDLILMDVQMPLMNGFEATAAIREKERIMGGHIPIIAMTAHAFKEDEERCLKAGMDAYISKPIDFKECLQRIGETFQKAGAPAISHYLD